MDLLSINQLVGFIFYNYDSLFIYLTTFIVLCLLYFYFRTDSIGKGRGRGKMSSPPPPLPPRAPQWVAFDEPERRRPPRRITTLPYTYVNPEECTCECHEAQHRPTDSQCSKAEQCTYTKKSSRTEKEKRFRT